MSLADFPEMQGSSLGESYPGAGLRRRELSWVLGDDYVKHRDQPGQLLNPRECLARQLSSGKNQPEPDGPPLPQRVGLGGANSTLVPSELNSIVDDIIVL